MKKIKLLIASLAFAGLAVAPLAFAETASAINPLDNICNSSSSSSEICTSRDEKIDTVTTPLINTLLFIVGLLSVIMIIVAGILYTTSGGDSGKVSKAKNMLTYAIVGLVVAFIAYAIVNWVLRLFDTPAGGTGRATSMLIHWLS